MRIAIFFSSESLDFQKSWCIFAPSKQRYEL
nr:MAG TPA: hypothetical protein [Caudoviricetes sp.]